MPKISVVMPVYNGEKYVRSAIESILAQSFADFELLVIDDGSTDQTGNIIQDWWTETYVLSRSARRMVESYLPLIGDSNLQAASTSHVWTQTMRLCLIVSSYSVN
ncbi:hypothetical protein AWV80_22620 [Cupriavidus sp. UYMU48A]|nr:hypothetical protein AWV80_22620 [Cupriavidus sp. UYMU48A]